MERQWDDLRIFLEVARSHSVPSASRSLMISDATVRRRIKALEDLMGVQLFFREEGSFQLTPSGLGFLPAIEAMESAALGAMEMLRGADSQIAGLVRLGAPDGIATALLAPLLADLQSKNPALSIELVSLTRAADLRRREVDVALIWDRPTRGEHRIRALRPTVMRFYATQAYLDRFQNPIGSLDDLEGHRFVGYPPSSHISRSLSKLLPSSSVVLRPHFTSSNIVVQSAVAANDAGLALLPRYIAALNPNLVGVLHDEFSTPFPIWLVTHNEMASLARVRAVADLVHRCFATLQH